MYIDKDKPHQEPEPRDNPVGVVLNEFIKNDRKAQEVTGDVADTILEIVEAKTDIEKRIDEFSKDVTDKIAEHTSRVGAIHGETKVTVGLGNKDNFRMGTIAEHIAGAPDNVYAHPAGLKELVQSRVKVNPDNYIPAGIIPYAHGGMIGEVPQYEYDTSIGEMLQSALDPKDYMFETPWEFSTSSGSLVFPSLNHSPTHGIYTQLGAVTPTLNSPHGGTKIRVYNKTLDARKTRPSNIRAWSSNGLGDMAQVDSSLMDRYSVFLKEGSEWVVRSFNKNIIPVDYFKLGAFYPGKPSGMFQFSEGLMYNLVHNQSYSNPIGESSPEIHSRYDYLTFGFRINDYNAVNGGDQGAEQEGTLLGRIGSFTGTVPAHGKLKFTNDAANKQGSIVIKLSSLVQMPAGVQPELVKNMSIKEFGNKIGFAWNNRMAFHSYIRLPMGWWNKNRTKYWHAWLDFEIIDVPGTTTVASQLRINTLDPAWNNPRQVMNANYDLTGEGLFKEYAPDVRENPTHPLALGGIFESLGGHVKTHTMYGRQYVSYVHHGYGDVLSMIQGGSGKFPAATEEEHSVRSTLNSNGLFGDHLRHIPVNVNRLQGDNAGEVTYLTQVRDSRERYRWAKVVIDGQEEVQQNRAFGNYLAPTVQSFDWMDRSFEPPKPFLISNDDFQDEMGISGMVFTSENSFIGFSQYELTEATDNSFLTYKDQIRLDSKIESWVAKNTGGYTNPDMLFFYFRNTIFFVSRCTVPGEYPADGKDATCGYFADCHVVGDIFTGKRVTTVGDIGGSVTMSKFNLNKKSTLEIDDNHVFGIDQLTGRDVYIMMTNHDNTTQAQSHDVMLNMGPFKNFYIEMKLIRNGDGTFVFRPKPEAVDPIFPYVEGVGYQIDYDEHIQYGKKLPHRLHINYQSPVMLKKGMWSFRKTPNNFGVFTRRHGFFVTTGCMMSNYFGVDVYPMGSVLTVSGKNTVVDKPVSLKMKAKGYNSELYVRLEGDGPKLYGTDMNPDGYELEPHIGAAPAGWQYGTSFFYYDPNGWRNSFLPVIDGNRMSWYDYGSTFPAFLGQPGSKVPTNRYFIGANPTIMTWDTSKGRKIPTISTLPMNVMVNGVDYFTSGTEFVIPAEYTGIVNIKMFHANTLKWAPGLVSISDIGNKVTVLDFSNSEGFSISAPLPRRIKTLNQTFKGAKAAAYPGIENWDVTHIQEFVETFRGAPLFNQPLNWVCTEGRMFNGMFQDCPVFNQDISGFKPVNGTLFYNMLRDTGAFNKPINWKLNSVQSMKGFLRGAKAFNSSVTGIQIKSLAGLQEFFMETSVYNQTLDGWDWSLVSSVQDMFNGAKAFNKDINQNAPQCHTVTQMFRYNQVFNSKVNIQLPICVNFHRMFEQTKVFNQKLPNWSFSPGTSLTEMFRGAEAYNQSMDHWMMERVVSVRGMFRDAVAFNTPVKTWKFYKLRDCAYLFAAPNFNADVNDIQWPNDKTLDIDAGGIFYGALVFNKPLNKWNVSAFGQFNGMFNNAPVFNQDISMWDTSNCWRMANLFLRATAFSGDISKWDVSKVIDFSQFAANAINFKSDLSKWKVGACLNFNRMFRHALAFNSPIGDWDVSNGVDFESMFDAYHITETVTEPNYAMTFNQDISKWNVGKGVKFNAMFRKCESFNQDISNWNMGNAEETGAMFQNCYLFNADLSKWNPGRLMNIKYMFYKASSFNRSIGHWDVSRCTEFTQVFLGATEFNQNLNNWNVSNGTDFKGMFESATKFNGTIGGWDVRKGVTFNRMFWHCFALDQDISAWRVDSGQNFQDMFRDCYYYNSPMNDWGMGNAITCTDMFTGCLTFNQPLDKWNTSRVTSMQAMFYKTPKFNQNLNNWTTSSVLNMANMFKGASVYNQPMDKWDVSKVTDFTNMFGPIADTDPYAFNQPLATWNTASAVNMTAMFRMCWNFNQKLTGWNTSNVTSMAVMFYRCERLVDPDVNGWNVGKVWSFESMFQGCSLFNGSLFAWRPVEARNMASMFQGATKFNSNISSWNMTKVGTFASMFQSAEAFNQDISGWNTSAATDMSNMFYGAVVFNAPIGSWNTGNVNNMSGMFHEARIFNQPIGTWNVGKVQTMESMFENAKRFNQPLANWNVSAVTTMSHMFHGAEKFNGLLTNWSTASVTDISWMFKVANDFNQPIGHFNTSKVTKMNNMFGAFYIGTANYFNQDISGWDVSNVVTMERMFEHANSYNKPMPNWKTGKVTSMDGMFKGARVFNQDISGWDVGNVTTMAEMFRNATMFNAPIGSWNTGNVTAMNNMFDGYEPDGDIGRSMVFNQPIGDWNVSNVTDFTAMFRFCPKFNADLQYWKVDKGTLFTSMFEEATIFNADISKWNVSNATNLGWMFRKAAAFNRDLSSWNTSKVTVMRAIFDGASAFNQPLNTWDVSKVADFGYFFNGAKVFNQDLSNWNTISATNMADMFHGATAFNKPIGNWNVSNVIAMNGMFTEATAFAQDISGWNVGKVANFNSMFRAALNFNSPVNDWNVSSATQMGSMFKGCPKFNQPLNKWDVSKVTNFGYMFDGWEDYPNGTTVHDMIFNQDLSMWNVSAGTTFHYMFRNCAAYNQSMANWKVGNATTMVAMFSNCKELTDPGIGVWDVRKVTLANYMFASCYKFNSNIAPWSTLACTNMDSMFENARLFNQDLSVWNVAKVTTHVNFDTGAAAWTKPRPNFA
ncbi:hypothetical protein PQC07_gp155 [Aeromonas phage D3]|uniref:BspA family leucine-rich repeat surface protein n=1 Tax=Aeromonas phage D3 TaxID=2593327 RepID=A0A514TVR2_9CAUD|nr:hypothetical protein PQC07_gp155 [Aeromonas phage D3]QDJ97118.1 hypothetical protein D3_0120 [Aeromonas phage D3]